MRTWRGVAILGAIVQLVVGCGGGTSLVDAAVGTWSCAEPPSIAHGFAYDITITPGGHFTVKLENANAGPDGSFVDPDKQPFGGTWAIDKGRLTIRWDARSPVKGLIASGVRLGATRVPLEPIASYVSDDTAKGPDAVIVHRTGLTRVTLQADERGATTWTCRKTA